jgi:hypothetical protein
LLVSRSVSLSSFSIWIIEQTFPVSNPIYKDWAGVQTFIPQWKVTGILTACASALSRCVFRFFCVSHFLTWLVIGSIFLMWSWRM